MSPGGGRGECSRCVVDATSAPRRGGGAARRRRAPRGRLPPALGDSAQPLELDERDVLRLAVLGDHEVLRRQPLDRLAVLSFTVTVCTTSRVPARNIGWLGRLSALRLA